MPSQMAGEKIRVDAQVPNATIPFQSSRSRPLK